MAVGWGRAGYGEDYWGATSVSVSLTGIAATASLGTALVDAEANVTLTGVSSTCSLGTPVIQPDCNVSPTGLSGVISASNVSASRILIIFLAKTPVLSFYNNL